MVHRVIKSISSYVIISSVFITGNGLVDVGFTVYWYYPVYIMFLLYGIIRYHKIDAKLLYFTIFLVLYSVTSFQYGTAGVLFAIKQLANIVISLAVFYVFLLHENFNYHEIFRKYIFFAKFILILGFIQVALFLSSPGNSFFLSVFSFLEGSNISFRLQSLTQEPSCIAYVFAPIVFLGLYNFFNNTSFYLDRTWSLLFIAGYLLTFSLVAYIGLFLMLIILYFRNLTIRKVSLAVFFVSFLGALAILAYSFIPFFKIRVDDTFLGVRNDVTDSRIYKQINLSSLAILTNLRVVNESLKRNIFFGSGLGTHPLNYDKYLPLSLRQYSSLNRLDANSMVLRLLSETGIVGLSLFCFFLFRFRIQSKTDGTYNYEFLWIINSGILIMVFLFLIRSGNYTINGRVLFLLIYYYSYRESRRENNEQAIVPLSQEV